MAAAAPTTPSDDESIETYLQLISYGKGENKDALDDDDDDSSTEHYDYDEIGLTEEMLAYMDLMHDLSVEGFKKKPSKKKVKKIGKKVVKYRVKNPDLAYYLECVRQNKKLSDLQVNPKRYPGIVVRKAGASLSQTPTVSEFMGYVEKKKRKKQREEQEKKKNVTKKTGKKGTKGGKKTGKK